MTLKLYEILVEIVCESRVRDVPQLDRAVLRGRRDDVVVERVPFNVQDGAAVPGNLKKKKRIKSTNKIVRRKYLTLFLKMRYLLPRE